MLLYQRFISAIVCLMCLGLLTHCANLPSPPSSSSEESIVKLIRDGEQVEVWMNGSLFTIYQQPDEVKKPILYPILTSKGTAITRGYPLDPKVGERADHPHHIGVWFNHGDVNDLDFWNNSTNVKPERLDHYGTIQHTAIRSVESGDEGRLHVEMEWLGPDRTVLLRESTHFRFWTGKGVRSLERHTSLTAGEDSVLFRDNKEGMFGIRLARPLEQVNPKPTILIGEDGTPSPEKVVDTTSVNGLYRNAAGQKGDDVWGTRGSWVCIDGKIGSESISVAMFDHAENPGYPASWHARNYGLFSVNNLGRKAYNKQEEAFHVSLAPGERLEFRHRLSVYTTDPSDEDLEKTYRQFVEKK
ncbi:MAG: PmoA family protein [Bacteroidota bacterium]